MISARRFSTNPLSVRNGPDFPSLQRTRRRSITLHLQRERRFPPLERSLRTKKVVPLLFLSFRDDSSSFHLSFRADLDKEVSVT